MKIPVSGMLISGPSGENSLQLERRIGGGAFGDVYEALDTVTGIPYAVKFPRISSIGNQREMDAFFNEVEAATHVRHMNVVQVVYVAPGKSDDLSYIVTEFIGGGTLKELIDKLRDNKQVIELEKLRQIATGLIDGINAINKKMLHRDLKPDNILMHGYMPKIADFGLSKLIGAATRTNTFKGGQHMYYMAPEGWKSETNQIQIDMYAMGIVLFEIASAQFPYKCPAHPDVSLLQDMHLFQVPTPLCSLRSELPKGYCHIVARLLKKRPLDRFSNWDEVSTALAEAWHLPSESASASTSVDSLLDLALQRHDASQRERLAAEKQQVEAQEKRRLDIFSLSFLIEDLDSVIVDFNRQSTLGNIKVTWPTAPQLEFAAQAGKPISARITLPYGDAIIASFFWVAPPLNLKQGQISFAACLKDGRGGGLNYLLRRDNITDLYGSWVVCRARNHPLVRRDAIQQHIEPFGFNNDLDVSLGRQNIGHIELADSSMHRYTVQFSVDIQDSFKEVLRDAMK